MKKTQMNPPIPLCEWKEISLNNRIVTSGAHVMLYFPPPEEIFLTIYQALLIRVYIHEDKKGHGANPALKNEKGSQDYGPQYLRLDPLR